VPEVQSSTDGQKNSLFIVDSIDGPVIKLDNLGIKDVQTFSGDSLTTKYDPQDGTVLINKDKVLAVYEYPDN
jgi:hypothetical protein